MEKFAELVEAYGSELMAAKASEASESGPKWNCPSYEVDENGWCRNASLDCDCPLFW